MENKPIKVYNYGNMIRDFTYIDDVIESIISIIRKSCEIKSKNIKETNNLNKYKIFNIGNSNPKNLKDYIKALELNLGKKADIIYEDIQRFNSWRFSCLYRRPSKKSVLKSFFRSVQV